MMKMNMAIRRKLAHYIRNLSTGIIDFSEYIEFSENLALNEDNTAYRIWTIIFQLSDPDVPGSDPPKDFIARVILFLNTELEYEWQDETGWDIVLFYLDIITCKLFTDKLQAFYSPSYEEQGDFSIYPFKNRKDFEKAKNIVEFI